MRPILINNWEATYFDFDESKLKRIARDARELGIECFVLDDGWFGHRDDDRTSLGDWKVDKRKLPHGLEGIVEYAHGSGLKFGLWFEPEMVSVDSDLYRAHPDWCLHVPGRSRSGGRGQLVLDLTRKEVRDYIVTSLSAVLGSLPIDYVKWDMNRHMTEAGSAALPPERQRETSHRYMLGLYEIMEKITRQFPDILFESCSGGGGRFDPGMLYYMPQTWTSDNTDAVSRLEIQYGTSIVYPPVTMGAHVSAAPNHQVHRDTPLKTRGHAAMSANLGYELDFAKLSETEKNEIREQTAWYKKHRRLVQFGAFYRLLNPFEGPRAAWMSVSPDRKEAVVHYFQIAAEANAPQTVLCLRGLDPALEYRVDCADRTFGGDELMEAGIRLPELKGDYSSVRIQLVCRG